jgi:cytochrome c peroxidase
VDSRRTIWMRVVGGCVLGLAAVWCAVGGAQERVSESIQLPALPADTLPPTELLTSIPLGFERWPEPPADNPLTLEKALLGRRLFFDSILSRDGSLSCASCHLPDHGLASPDPVAIGIGGQRGRRNSPSLYNVAWGKSFFWDGRSMSLEEQALAPIVSPLELGSDLPAVVGKLRRHAAYPQLFAEAFPGEPDPVTEANLAKSLASFERTLVRAGAEVDRFHAAEYEALSPEARQGLWIFESRGFCWQCHAGSNFSDEAFHNTGVGFGRDGRDLGRFEVTGDERHRFQFKTPSLRGVASTAPYMHDGSIRTLEEVVEFYSKGGAPSDPGLDPQLRPLHLSEVEKANLVEYLKALSK